MVLCFRFWPTIDKHTNVLAIAEQCSHSVKVASVSHSTALAIGWGCAKGCEGTQLEYVTQTDQKDTPYFLTSCSEIKLGGSLSKVAVAQVGHWSAGGRWLVIWLASLACMLGFFSPLIYPDLGVFSPHFCLSDSLTHPTAYVCVCEWATGWVLPCHSGSTYDRLFPDMLNMFEAM